MSRGLLIFFLFLNVIDGNNSGMLWVVFPFSTSPSFTSILLLSNSVGVDVVVVVEALLSFPFLESHDRSTNATAI